MPTKPSPRKRFMTRILSGMRENRRSPGASLIEVLVALGIASIVITTAFSAIGNVYFAQKQLRVSQDFYAESRFLMERIVQLIRNNTLDYDRYFIVSGPPTLTCGNFDADQTPGATALVNNLANRTTLEYETIFAWDTDGDDTQDRNLGGQVPAGTDDPCIFAWDGTQDTLYLINGNRTIRTAIRRTTITDVSDADYRKLEIQTELGADTDGDNRADIWSVAPTWNNGGSGICEITSGSTYPILDDETSQDVCNRAHDWTIVSPHQLQIDTLTFEPSPSRDPFLAFAVDGAQIHPHVFVALETTLRDPTAFGFSTTDPLDMALQTTASSRVFGNTRE